VGGMTFGTLLTVFVVPTMYSLFARKSVPGPNKKEVIDSPAEATHAHS
jgi:multidrug efflux pump